MPLYKGGERGLSVWQHLTDTYQTFTFLKYAKSREEVAQDCGKDTKKIQK